MNRISKYIKLPFFIPHFLVYYFDKNELHEIECWAKALRIKRERIPLFFCLIINFKEFRSLFYKRHRVLNILTSWYASGQTALYIHTPQNKIGSGLIIQHGPSSEIYAERIGSNCQIWQNVTIGVNRPWGEIPIIGDNCKIFAGAVVAGGITLGDNVTVGANAVVVKNVPNNCVVVGNPARIVRKNGERVNISL